MPLFLEPLQANLKLRFHKNDNTLCIFVFRLTCRFTANISKKIGKIVLFLNVGRKYLYESRGGRSGGQKFNG